MEEWRCCGWLIGLALAAQLGCVRLGYDPHLSDGPVDDSAPVLSSDEVAADSVNGAADSVDRAAPDLTDPAEPELDNIGAKYDEHVVSLTPVTPASRAVSVWLTLQAQRGGYVQQFTLEGSTVEPQGAPISLPAGASVRGLAVDHQSRLLIGDGHRPRLLRMDTSTEPASVNWVTLSLEQQRFGSVHGVCSLPGGNIVAGEFTVGGPNLTLEFADEGDRLRALSTVYASVPRGHALSHCAAASDEELFVTEYDGMNDRNGDLVHLVRQADGQWIEGARFDVSAFDAQLDGTNDGSAVYTFVLHRDGFVYLFPLRRFGGRLERLIRCPAANISHDQCVQLGALPSDGTSSVTGPDAIQGAAELPDGDLLFASARGLYRFSLAEDRFEELFDLQQLTLSDQVGSDPLKTVRGLVVLP